jgi:hypothetical protein
MDDFLKHFQGIVPSRSDPAFEKRMIAQLLAYRAKFDPINVALRAVPPNIPAEDIPSLLAFLQELLESAGKFLAYLHNLESSGQPFDLNDVKRIYGILTEIHLKTLHEAVRNWDLDLGDFHSTADQLLTQLLRVQALYQARSSSI